MSKPVRWNDLADPGSDLCTTRRGHHFDVMWLERNQTWAVYGPCPFKDAKPLGGILEGRYSLSTGSTDRNVAQALAEKWIKVFNRKGSCRS